MNNINTICNRNHIANNIKQLLIDYNTKSKEISYKKGIYILGTPGSGKTQFIMDILKEINYDYVKYDAGDVRNKSLINIITSNNISNHNVLHLMSKQKKNIVIVMDEIDGMNNGDKGGITALIKVIRQKKTKKQKLENTSISPIICIGNYYVDKKIKELMKVCNVFVLDTPSDKQIEELLLYNSPNYKHINNISRKQILKYIQGDLRKYSFVYNVLQNNMKLLNDENILNIFNVKQYDEDSKKITNTLIQKQTEFNEHDKYMNDTDRTIVALLWHENIIDILSKYDIKLAFPLYLKILNNICFSDYIDRITFQKQIWQFNEMSSLIKTFYTNHIYHKSKINTKKHNLSDIRFTKVLTKYSTEYNNTQFLYYLSQIMDLDISDLLTIFTEYRIFSNKYCINNDIFENELQEKYDISSLEIKRIYRFLDKNVKNENVILNEDADDIDDI